MKIDRKNIFLYIIIAISLIIFLQPSFTYSASNLPPSVSAGPDQSISSSENAVLEGSVSDDGLPNPPGVVNITWRKIIGPGIVTFSESNMANTSVSFSEDGYYVLELFAYDGELSGSDRIIIAVGTGSVIKVPQDFATIQSAIDTSQNGDVVLISPGTYIGSLTLNKAVTLTSRFFITGDELNIANTILDGSGNDSVIHIPPLTPERPMIMGFTIQNATDGIHPESKFDFIHNLVRDTRDGIDYESDSGGLCQFNVFEMNRDDGIDLDQAVDIIISDNIIRENNDDGIEIRMHPYNGPNLNIIVRNNIIYGNGEDGIQIIDYPDLSNRFILIERNLIRNNIMAGVGLMDNGETVEDYRAASIPESIHVFNNTFFENDYGLTGGDNLIALNNLFVNSTTLAMKNVDGISIVTYNLFWNNGTSGDEHEQGSNVENANTIYENPLFGENFQLLFGSPAIDAGTSFFQWQGETVLSIPDTDYYGSAPDQGLYESICGIPPNTTPMVSIDSPADGSNFLKDDIITFSGTAADTQDGDLTPNLTWVSDRDGSIGSGGSFSTSDLSTDVHTITATAVDNCNLQGSNQIVITVAASLFCDGDFDQDSDIDGMDLHDYNNQVDVSLNAFSTNFGRLICP